MAELLPCPLSVYSPEPGQPGEEELLEDLDVGRAAKRGARIRAGILAQSGFLRRWGGREARVPLTSEEAREQVTIRNEADELAAIRMLRDCAAVSGGIYMRLGLTRSVISD